MTDPRQTLIARLAAGPQTTPVTRESLERTLKDVAASTVDPYTERTLPDSLMSPYNYGARRAGTQLALMRKSGPPQRHAHHRESHAI